MKKRYYIAYGSNINVEQMKMRCPTAKLIGTSKVLNHQLLFKGCSRSSYLTIEPKKSSYVPVVVWVITQSDEDLLDQYEGFPRLYYKKRFKLFVKLFNSSKKIMLDTFAYIMHNGRTLGLPNKLYIEKCFKGYRTFGFDQIVLKKAIYESQKQFK